LKGTPTFLQKKITDQIDDFCGITELVKFLNRFQHNKTPSEKLQCFTVINYYESLYLYKVPVEDDCIDFRQSGLEILEFLNREKCLKDCNYLFFLTDLLDYSLEYNSKVRRLA
jgi:hypothetical protein